MVRSPASPRDASDAGFCRAVVEAIAAAEQVDPTALEPPLGEVIDVEAADELFAGPQRDSGRLVFRYHGYRVTVESDGQVSVDDADGAD